MKTLPWKKIGITVVSLAIVLTGVLYFTRGNSAQPRATAINPAFGEFISSYTAGVVESGAAIRIVFSKDAVDSAAAGSETSVKLLSFSPSVKGNSRWLDRKTLEFKPSERMTSGRIYEVSLALSKLFDTPKELSSFEYSFQVMPQNFEVAVQNIKPYVKTELARQKIEGSLTTADFAEATAVEGALTATQEGKALKISWVHTPEGRQHTFVVEDVVRKDSSSIVKLQGNGKSLGTAQTSEREVSIPGLTDFKVTWVGVEQSGNQHVVIQFSDPLNEKQNLQGLIQVAGLTDLDFEIKDNEINVYPNVRQTGTKALTVTTGVRNILNYKMAAPETFDVVFEAVKPAVRFVGKGSILPSTDGMVLPFEAVSLKAVQVEIIKVFETNVLQFLQVNDYDGNQELRRVGRPLIKKHLTLDNAGVTDLGKWNRFTLDLSTLIAAEPGAIYQVKLSFKRSDTAYPCTEGDDADVATEEEDWSQSEGEDSNWDGYEDYYYGEGYDWDQRDNPCHRSYYTGQRSVFRNVIASDIGLIAKRGGDGNTFIAVNELLSTGNLVGAQIEIYDYQLQKIGGGVADREGKVVVHSNSVPFVIVAKNGTQRGYLKMQDGESLSLSNFDAGGQQVKKGIKGFIYGERGVWRPGDSLFMSFLLEDRLKLLPPNHPVVFELQNPQGQVTNRQVKAVAENGFYKFATFTAADAATGSWLVRAKVGGTEFSTPVRIEMVKPNRLKIDLNFGVDKLTAGANNISGDLKVNWLQGSPGKNLKAEFEVLLTKGETKFARYADYVFDDPSRNFTSEAQTVFQGYTDENGNAKVNASLTVSNEAPGMLNAVFRGKVFEEGGNFSIDRFTIPFYPYSSFTGIHVPPGDKARGMLLTDTTQRVDVVTVDADGNPVSRDVVNMAIYKINWRWWWDNTGGGDASIMSGQYAQPIQTGTIKTINGKGSWDFKIKYPEWGRYLIRATDPVSGHSTAKVVYIDWPGWAGKSRGGNAAATMLSFSTDKASYAVGEKVSGTIPGVDHGRALVSVENGSSVIETFWLETKKGDNPFSFEATKEMTPNVFVSVTLLQPHSQTVNDLPMRMYGVIPVMVENPETHLTPVIEMPDVLEPGQEVSIKISEKTNRKMTYSVAVVEEGLLDLTHYKTPDPWNTFYAREALGVKTWDLYDNVIGSLGGKIERLLAVGGDGEAASKEDDSKANRFKPVVKFLGPFTLNGGSREHKFIMPQYIGSVKTMVVAGYEGAYGKADKATPVRKPLMVLATLPRVLGPEENLRLPVTLFTTDKSIQNVKVEIKVSGPVTLPNGNTLSVAMQGSDKTVEFALAVKSETGHARVEVIATSGNYKSSDVIDITVRNPNPPVTTVVSTIVEPGKTWNSAVSLPGIAGTNSATLEVSTLPPVNLGQRMKYLIQYPYGCIEQTTSSVFPQLYLSAVKQLTPAEKSMTQSNIKAGIDRLRLFVTRDGGFAYWPGNEDSDSWGTTYGGHFLIEAERLGYFVPADMIKRWKKFQRERAQSWRKNQDGQSAELIQAYRLYTLALAGDAELGAMNRLREQPDLPLTASWMLAAAYVRAGQPEAATQLIKGKATIVKPYQEMAYSYGSDLRDEAIILETLLLLKERAKGFDLLKQIGASLSNSNVWMSTQSVAWCLKSVASFAASEQKGELKFTYQWSGGKEVTVSTDLPIAQLSLPADGVNGGDIKITSVSKGTLFTRVITEGVPARGTEDDASNNLSLDILYTDTKGNAIDPSSIEQATSFVATVTVFNPGTRGTYKNMALNQIFPSGWEINNLRLDDAQSRLAGDVPTWQDIRDDRVYTYFDIPAGQRKVFRLLLTASYAGTYYLPSVTAEAMYDHTVFARKKGQVTVVAKPPVN